MVCFCPVTQMAQAPGFFGVYWDFPTFNHFFPLRATIRRKKTPVNHAPGFWLDLQALSGHQRNMPMQIMGLSPLKQR
jgi:hypothetical protein